jgi:hypothetical protein
MNITVFEFFLKVFLLTSVSWFEFILVFQDRDISCKHRYLTVEFYVLFFFQFPLSKTDC